MNYHEFPEKYPHWFRDIDSRYMSELIERLLNQLKLDLSEPPDRRNMTPGLREALRCVAVTMGILLSSDPGGMSQPRGERERTEYVRLNKILKDKGR